MVMQAELSPLRPGVDCHPVVISLLDIAGKLVFTQGICDQRRLGVVQYRPLPGTELTLSTLGLGSYGLTGAFGPPVLPHVKI